MGYLDPGYIVRCQKGSYPPIFANLERHINEATWGDTWKILILGQNESLEAGEDLLTPTKSPSQTPINLEEVDKNMI